MRLSEMKYDIEKGTGRLEFDKMKTVQCAANLYTWIMETEEQVLIETLALNGGEIALKRWCKVINKALKMAAEVNKGKGKSMNVFHGGCIGCGEKKRRGVAYCQGCRYCGADWSLPNLFVGEADKIKGAVNSTGLDGWCPDKECKHYDGHSGCDAKVCINPYLAARKNGEAVPSASDNKSSTHFPTLGEVERDVFLFYVSKCKDGGLGPSTKRVIRDTYNYISRKTRT